MTTPTRHLITVKDEWGTPKNQPSEKGLPAPGIKDGEWLAETTWQCSDETGWFDVGVATFNDEMPQKYRQIYTLFPEAPNQPIVTVDKNGTVTSVTMQSPVVGEKKQQMPSDNPECDWKEDAEHENGNYSRRCTCCGRDFIGHKWRVTCKVCVGEKSGGEGMGKEYQTLTIQNLIDILSRVDNKSLPVYLDWNNSKDKPHPCFCIFNETNGVVLSDFNH